MFDFCQIYVQAAGSKISSSCTMCVTGVESVETQLYLFRQLPRNINQWYLLYGPVLNPPQWGSRNVARSLHDTYC